MAHRHLIANLTPYAWYTVKRAGATLLQRVASSGGTILFTATNGATINVDQRDTYDIPSDFHTKYAALMAPVPGEVFLAPAELRLVASGGFFNNLGATTADSIQWFDGDDALSVTGSDQYRTIFRARTSGLAAGTHRIWCRVTYSDGTSTDSKPHVITVSAAPTYGQTITLTGDTAWNSAMLGSGTLTGSAGSKIKVNAAGFVINGSASANLSWTHVDVVNLGATVGQTLTKGLDITVTGNVSWNTVRFDACSSLEMTVNNGTEQTVSIVDCLFRSNARSAIGQSETNTGNVTTASMPCLLIDGTASGAKVFQGNNVGAGWVVLNSSNWTVGGTTDAHSNVLMGPRTGLFLTADQSTSSFTGVVKRNFSYQIYYGEWSQGSNLELQGVTAANGIVEHNVIMGSSWPTRGVSCEFRYNLVLGDYFHHEGCWFGSSTHGNANVHHNVIRTSDVSAGRGGFWNTYSASPAFRNNTLDGVNNDGGGSMFVSDNGTPIFNSNIVVRSDLYAVTVSGGGLTADYNCFNANDTNSYSHQALQTNDITTAPAFNAVPTTFCPFDLAAVWARTKTTVSILSDYRGYYQPTAAAMDGGDTGTYGANNPRGAICRSGVSNSNDLFGTLT